MSNHRTNYGIAVLNEAPIGKTATIAATGLGRSGTTMLARVMLELGLPMGERVTPQSAEDKELQTLLKDRDLDGFGAACRARDAAHPVWGFKCPALRGSLVPATARMRHPRLILIFRDIMAVAQRNTLSVDAELLAAMTQAAQNYAKLMRAVPKLRAPLLMISYEKALQYPDRTVQAIAGFCGQPVDEARAAEIAAATIRNADPRYTGTGPSEKDRTEQDQGEKDRTEQGAALPDTRTSA